MSERKLIKEFLNRANLDSCLMCGEKSCTCLNDYCKSCYCNPCECSENSINMYNNNHHLDSDENEIISQEDLYTHFDLNNDGKVTNQEYVDHIHFHCEHPESLEYYNKVRDNTVQTVPCVNSYDSCGQHLMGSPDDIDKFLKPLMDQTGSTCRESTARAFIDVLQSLLNCGVLG
jgi:hypothetical protein